MSPSRWAKGLIVQAPGRPAPARVRFILRTIEPLVRLCHRPTLEGIANLPERGPFLLVANHSAGLGVAEILCFLVLHLRDVGPERLLTGFAIPVGFRIWPLGVALIACYGPGTWPLRAALCWLWLGSALSFAPWIPWTIRMRIGAPSAAEELFHGEGTDEELRRALPRVEAAVQALVSR